MSALNDALIVGAGIGGLTTALAMARRGLNVTVLEQATALSSVGAGIQLSPNATQVLSELGLASALAKAATQPQASQTRDFRTGKLLAEAPLGDACRRQFGFPYYQLHRADLIELLVQAIKDAGNARVLLNSKVQRIESNNQQAIVHTENQSLHTDLIIGADGIHSTVRQSLLGKDNLQFAGNLAWRALVRAGQLPDQLREPVTTVWMGPGRHFVHYPVRGGDWINCVGVVESDTPTNDANTTWTALAADGQLKRDFAGWHDLLQTLIDAVEPSGCYQWSLFDRQPMTRWSGERITLLGDACHPTLPFMAQGAALAIEDAAVLDACLATDRSLASALAKYESIRQPRTKKIQQVSRRNGRIFHSRGLTAWARNQVLGPAARRSARMVYQYDALAAVRSKR